jgi:hypothetical protein
VSNTLVISNLDLGDETFESDVASWNVTRALRDCEAGKHQLFWVDVVELVKHNEAVTVDAEKVAAMLADPARMRDVPPLILITDDGKDWLVDGHHRLRALHQLGFRECVAYVIAEQANKPYRVYFNGQRVAPWFKKE